MASNIYIGTGRSGPNPQVSNINNNDVFVNQVLVSNDPTKRAFEFGVRVRNAGNAPASCVVHICTWDSVGNLLYQCNYKQANGLTGPAMSFPQNVVGGGAPALFKVKADIPLSTAYVAAVVYADGVFPQQNLPADTNKRVGIKVV